MASYQDLLDAIGRIRQATGDREAWQSGLSGGDIAVACNALSSPGALGAVLTKIVAGHRDVFMVDTGTTAPPRVNDGLAADAIRDTETALAQQNSTAAQIDLQVVTAILNAHATDTEGTAELERLQREIEHAVLSRTDLDTQAGAREFQRFLIGKLRNIRMVVDTAGLDSTSKAALVAALASLYVSSTPQLAGPLEDSGQRLGPEHPSAQSDTATPVRPAGSAPRETASRQSAPVGAVAGETPLTGDLTDMLPWEFAVLPAEASEEPPPTAMAAPVPAAMPAPAMSPPSMAPAAPGWAGGATPFGGGGIPAFPHPDLGGSDYDGGDDARRSRDSPHVREADLQADDRPEESAEVREQEGQVGDSTMVRLPDGQIVRAPTPELAAAIGAAVAGTPVVDAFRQQGITVPPPGSAVTAAVDPARLLPGDIGVLADRHAVALGNGKALLDAQIQAIDTVMRPGFLGWQHPPAPGPTTTDTTTTDTTADLDAGTSAPTWPAETAPS